MNIDPIVVREELVRLEMQRNVLIKGIQAAKALLWFKSVYDSPIEKTLSISVVCGSTGLDANSYLHAAARTMARDVMDRAITAATKDYDRAEKVRRGEIL